MKRSRYVAIALFTGFAIVASSTRSEATSVPNAADTTCTAKPGLVSETDTMRVKAGKVVVTCGHAWKGIEVVEYRDIYARPAKWIFGGTLKVSGEGSVVLPPFVRDYHECGDWRLHFKFKDGDSFNGAVSWFCT